MTARQLLESLLATELRAEAQTAEELIRLKERLDQQRQHRMALQETVDKLKSEAAQ